MAAAGISRAECAGLIEGCGIRLGSRGRRFPALNARASLKGSVRHRSHTLPQIIEAADGGPGSREISRAECAGLIEGWGGTRCSRSSSDFALNARASLSAYREVRFPALNARASLKGPQGISRAECAGLIEGSTARAVLVRYRESISRAECAGLIEGWSGTRDSTHARPRFPALNARASLKDGAGLLRHGVQEISRAECAGLIEGAATDGDFPR